MRSWLVIPAMAVATGAAAVGLGARAPLDLIASVAVGAAITATIRALAGDSPASLTGAVLAPLLLIALLFDPALGAGGGLARAGFAIAAAGWTIVELSRPSTSPLVAVLPATVAMVLSPAFVALVAIAGSRLMTAPWRRPRWAIAVPIVGGLALMLALLSGLARGGVLGGLGQAWFGAAAPRSAGAIAALTGDALGPIVAVAAIGGIACLLRPRHAELALLSSAIAALLISLRAGAVNPALAATAAMSAGLAVGRLAGQIRLGVGQAVAGATVGVLLVVPPAWTSIEHGARVTNVQRSR